MNRFPAAILTLFILAAFARTALAQSAPAGNAHPEARDLEETSLANPFGPPLPGSPCSIEEKHAFALEVDLSALRDLAVFHNGRVKIMDTLAQEVVQGVAGRKNYLDFIPADDNRDRTLAYDPLFTLLDLMIDPAYYRDKPIAHIEYLPLRRALLDETVESEAERERWMRLTRLSPAIIMTGVPTISGRLGGPEIDRAFAHINAVFNVLRFGHGALHMVAPPDGPSAELAHAQWRHISSLPADSPIRAAFLDLGAAWRGADVAAVERAAETIARELPLINPAHYPTTQRSLERAYNAMRPFEWGYWMYFLSLVALLLAFGTGRRWLVAVGVTTLLIAAGLHAFGFAARWVIAERLPIQNQFESMTGLSLGGVLVGLVLMLGRRQWLFGAAAAGVGFLSLLTATTTAIPGESIGREAAILNTSVLLKYHVTTVLVSYGLITLGFFISLLYLWTWLRARAGDRRAAALAAQGLGLDDQRVAGPQRVLSDLDKAQMTVLQLAFWTLGVGILLGAWWADHSWGRWWAFDPKETWALVTWIIYLIVIHVRLGVTKNRGLVTAWLSVLGFIVMLWTYFGVNLLLPGLHAYA